MNSYYLTLVLKSDLEEKERKALLDGVVKRLVGNKHSLPSDEGKHSLPSDEGKGDKGDEGDQGKVVKEDFWGNKDLAYPIKRQSKGFYAHFEISADPKGAKGLDKTLKLEEDILRYLLVRR